MFELIAEYGDKIGALFAAALVAVLGRYVWDKINRESLRAIAQRACAEVIDAVLEVWQTYVSGLKKGRDDGQLTDEEKAIAKRMAIETAKTNLGAKGLARLARALGFGTDLAKVENWIGSKAETAIATLKGVGLMKTPAPAAPSLEATVPDPR